MAQSFQGMFYNLKIFFRIICCGRLRILRALVSSCCVCGVLILVLLSLTNVQEKITRVTKLISCDDDASQTFLQKLVRTRFRNLP